MTVQALVHPRMLAGLARFYPSLCEIQAATQTNVSGEVTLTWAGLALHLAIPCRVPPAGGQEVKRPDHTYTVATHVIELSGYYPAVTPTMRAVVGTLTYDILAVESDGNGYTTRLQCQIVKASA